MSHYEIEKGLIKVASAIDNIASAMRNRNQIENEKIRMRAMELEARGLLTKKKLDNDD